MFVFRCLVILTIAVVIVFAAILIYPQYSRRELARRDLEIANRMWEQKTAEREGMRLFLNGLENSPATIEKVAREKFNYSRDGEVIVKMVEAQ